MLNLFTVLKPVEVVEGRRLRIEKALAHDQDEIALSQNLVNRGVLENKTGLGKDSSFGLKAGLVVLTITVVLVEIVRAVLCDLVCLPPEYDIVEPHIVSAGCPNAQ